MLNTMLVPAIKCKMRIDNPARGIEREPKSKRERSLTPAEIAPLGDALDAHPETTSCNAIQLLLTGTRKGETLSASWMQFDLDAGVWLKPAASTKTKKGRRVPLSGPAIALLVGMRKEADPKDPYVVPGQAKRDADGKRVPERLPEIKRVSSAWCQEAGLSVQVPKLTPAGKPSVDAEGKWVMVGKPKVRTHDLPHSYAAILASSGLSLTIIGALLGHSQARTTARYAHLLDDPLRAATERVGAVVTGAGKAGAEVVPLAGARPA